MKNDEAQSQPNESKLEVTDVHALSRFESKYPLELQSIQGAVVAYQEAFNERVWANPVRVDVWKLGAGEVHQGGHTAQLWVETRNGTYGDMDVLVIKDGYNPKYGGADGQFRQVDTFELSTGGSDIADHVQAVGLMVQHDEARGGSYTIRTLIPSIEPVRFREMVASVKELADKPVPVPVDRLEEESMNPIFFDFSDDWQEQHDGRPEPLTATQITSSLAIMRAGGSARQAAQDDLLHTYGSDVDRDVGTVAPKSSREAFADLLNAVPGAKLTPEMTARLSDSRHTIIGGYNASATLFYGKGRGSFVEANVTYDVPQGSQKFHGPRVEIIRFTGGKGAGIRLDYTATGILAGGELYAEDTDTEWGQGRIARPQKVTFDEHGQRDDGKGRVNIELMNQLLLDEQALDRDDDPVAGFQKMAAFSTTTPQGVKADH